MLPIFSVKHRPYIKARKTGFLLRLLAAVRSTVHLEVAKGPGSASLAPCNGTLTFMIHFFHVNDI